MAKVPESVRQRIIDRATRLNERQGVCEVQVPPEFLAIGSWSCFYWANNIHHRVNRSVGGGHELGSLLLACGSGTTGCHGWITEHRTLARDYGWLLRSTDDIHGRRVLYRGRWAILTDDGQVLYQDDENH